MKKIANTVAGQWRYFSGTRHNFRVPQVTIAIVIMVNMIIMSDS